MRIGHCAQCGQDFEWAKVKGFVPTWCPPCGDDRRRTQARAKTATWRASDPVRAKASQDRYNAKRLADPEHRRQKREAEIRRKYGISAGELAEILTAQGGGCAICGRVPAVRDDSLPLPKGTASTLLHVDHDHDSGRVRGLLCGNCNTMIGLAGEDPAVLASAITYLKKE